MMRRIGPARGARGAASGNQTFRSTPDLDLVLTFDLSPSGQGDGGGWIAVLRVAAQTVAGDQGNTLSLYAGDGAPASVAVAGAAGGNREDYGGSGGDGNATRAAGAAGYWSAAAGFPGANGGGGGGAGGDAYLDPTKGTGSARNGDLLLATYAEHDAANYGVRYARILPASQGQFLLGATAPVSNEKGRFSGSISPAANADAALYRFDGTIVEAGSGTHALIAGVHITAPTVTAGAGAVTAAATVYISGAPVASGAAVYPLWIDAGTPRIDSVAANATTACVLTAASGPAGANTAVQEWLVVNINGTTRYIPTW